MSSAPPSPIGTGLPSVNASVARWQDVGTPAFGPREREIIRRTHGKLEKRLFEAVCMVKETLGGKIV